MELPEGRLLNPPNLPGWENFELRQVLERRLRRTVVVENDANVAALAECAGARKGTQGEFVVHGDTRDRRGQRHHI